jgi:hypothetical protein
LSDAIATLAINTIVAGSGTETPAADNDAPPEIDEPAPDGNDNPKLLRHTM